MSDSAPRALDSVVEELGCSCSVRADTYLDYGYHFGYDYEYYYY